MFLTQCLVVDFEESVLRLAECRNWKLKNKALSLMSYFIEISGNCWKTMSLRKDQDSLITFKVFSQLIKSVFTLAKNFISTLKDSKLMYSVLYNIMSLFKVYEAE